MMNTKRNTTISAAPVTVGRSRRRDEKGSRHDHDDMVAPSVILWKQWQSPASRDRQRLPHFLTLPLLATSEFG